MYFKIKELMSDFWIRYTKSDPESIVDVYFITPDFLLTPRRLDIIPKLLYIDSVLNHRNKYLTRQLYKENIRAFVGRKYNEIGTKGKDSLSKHFEQFLMLIENVKKHGFKYEISAVTLDADGTVIDGIHRSAVSIYFQKDLPVFNIPYHATICDFSYFRSRGMSTSCIEYMVHQFVLLNNDTLAISISYFKDSDYYQLLCAIEESYDIIYSKYLKIRIKNNYLFPVQYAIPQIPDIIGFKNRYEKEKNILLFIKPHKKIPWQKRKEPFLKMVIERQMTVKIAFRQQNCRELSYRFFGSTFKQKLSMQYAFMKTVIIDTLKIERKEMDMIDRILLDKKKIDALAGVRDDLVKQLRNRYLRNIMRFLSIISNRIHPNHHFFNEYSKQLNNYTDEEALEILSSESYNDYIFIKYFPQVYLDNRNKSL